MTRKTTSFGRAACAAGTGTGDRKRTKDKAATAATDRISTSGPRLSAAEHGQVAHRGDIYIVYGAAHGVPPRRQPLRKQPWTVRDVEHRVGGETQRNDHQSLARIADHRHRGEQQEPHRECDVEADAGIVFPTDPDPII